MLYVFSKAVQEDLRIVFLILELLRIDNRFCITLRPKDIFVHILHVKFGVLRFAKVNLDWNDLCAIKPITVS